MNYCKRCILPDTRPGLSFDNDGVCSACNNQEHKHHGIDWSARSQELQDIFSKVRSQSRGYDCIIPVSGGKDSTWQVVKCLESGLRVLAVTWRTPGRTDVGQRNLDNLIRLGVDHIDYSISPEVEKKFTYKSLWKTGSTAVPMHMALFAIPLRIAIQFKIPLVVWGESPTLEYGGTGIDRDYNRLDLNWLARHGILQGTVAADWIDEELSEKDLTPYFLPSAEEFATAGIQSIFLGHYLPWDVEESLRVALENGFEVRREGPKVGYYNYADIDCDFVSIHHYFKWLKFGFTRLFDNLSIEIRNGRMTREQALEVLKRLGDQRPAEDIRKLCAFLNISEAHFREIEEKYRNHAVWKFENNRWVIPGFIIADWKWN